MNDETAAQFVHSVVKSLQALCHGYVEFGQGVEIIGHLYLNVDKRLKYNYIVQEQVCKSEIEGKTIFISNSYHASPSKKCLPRQQESPQTVSEPKSHGNKRNVDFLPYSEQVQSTSQETSHSVSDGADLSSIAPCHDVQPMYSSTPQSENIFHRKRNHSGGLSREQADSSLARFGALIDPSKQFDKAELLSNEQTSHSGPSFSPKAAQRLSSNIERVLNSGNFSKNENTSSGHSVAVDIDKIRHVTPNLDSFSNNTSHGIGVLPTDVHSSDIKPHQRLGPISMVSASKTVTNESRKRFLKDRCVGAVRNASSTDNDYSVDLSCVKKETDTAATLCSVQDNEERIVYHDQRRWSRSSAVDPQDSSSYSGEDESKMDSGTDDESALSSQDMMQHAAPYPLSLHPNSGASGYGGPVFPQSFPDNTPDQQASTSSPDNDGMLAASPLNMLGHISTASGFSRGSFNNPSVPRPGKVSAEVAAKYNATTSRQADFENSSGESHDGRKAPLEHFVNKKKLKELIIQASLTRGGNHLKPLRWQTSRPATVAYLDSSSSDHPLNLCLDSPSSPNDQHQGVLKSESTFEVPRCSSGNISTEADITAKRDSSRQSSDELQASYSPSRKPKVLKLDTKDEQEDRSNYDQITRGNVLHVDMDDRSFSPGSISSGSVDTSSLVKAAIFSPIGEQFPKILQQLQTAIRYEPLVTDGPDESSVTSKQELQHEQHTSAAPKGSILPTITVTKHGFEPVLHYLELVPATIKQNRGARKRCRVCYSTGKRRDSRFQCAVCITKPGLCANPCMQIYHEQMLHIQNEMDGIPL